MIELHEISKTYPAKTAREQEVHALKNVTLHIPKGQITGIIGSSGAGKSTLVRCINLLETPDTGSVIVGGLDLTKLSGKELRQARRNIGMIFQHFNLLHSATVFDNVAAPLKNGGRKSRKEIREKVEQMLELTGLKDKAYAYPASLSGGQKQRVAIARALCSDPDILLCDEATSALDPNTTASILQLISDLQKKLNLTVVMIAHQMEVIKSICTSVAVMEDGQIVEQGSIEEIFSAPQSTLTKDFSDTSLHMPQAKEDAALLKRNLYKLTFDKDNAHTPLIASIVKAHPVDISILYGSIERLAGHPFGRLIADITGEPEDIQNALASFEKEGVKVEVIPYA